MANNTGTANEIVEQLAWLVRSFRSAIWAGIIAAALVAILAYIQLQSHDKQTFSSRIVYGLQPKSFDNDGLKSISPEIRQQKETILRLAPVVPKSFTTEQIEIWHGGEFARLLSKTSNSKFRRLSDVDFEIKSFEEDGVVFSTIGRDEDAEIHQAFHKQVADIIIARLAVLENLLISEAGEQLTSQKQQLSGIDNSRDVLSREREASIAMMEEILKKSEAEKNSEENVKVKLSDGGAVIVDAQNDPSQSEIVIAIAQKREELTRQSDGIRQLIAKYENLQKSASRAHTDIVASQSTSEDAFDFTFRLIIWLFLIILSALVAPLMWSALRAVIVESRKPEVL